MKNIAQQKQATMEMIAQAHEKIVIEQDRKTKASINLLRNLVATKRRQGLLSSIKNTKLPIMIAVTLILKATARSLLNPRENWLRATLRPMNISLFLQNKENRS
ncbi:hypothetical protein ACHAW5_003706 [Stephanodiscus triporus]|uniref:Uncharacterized protein n=1 Tax=Stephanodiscus triporus TaxID=2934178 RepID=A0ABD3QI03_9STRA